LSYFANQPQTILHLAKEMPMGFKVYDFRNDEDISNLLVTPHIRSRFLRMEPGAVASRHSHDLGHEIFLILQGRMVFEISGAQAELGPGQMCIALTDEPHQVRVISDEPMIMYLSVTPHIQPTHTDRDDEGNRLPISFQPSSSYDVETDTETPIDELVDRQVEAARRLAEIAQEGLHIHEQAAARLKSAVTAGNDEEAAAARQQIWEGGIYPAYKHLEILGDLWNSVSPRAGKLG
jgi:quercetin dioxygenase-like cupin family protein